MSFNVRTSMSMQWATIPTPLHHFYSIQTWNSWNKRARSTVLCWSQQTLMSCLFTQKITTLHDFPATRSNQMECEWNVVQIPEPFAGYSPIILSESSNPYLFCPLRSIFTTLCRKFRRQQSNRHVCGMWYMDIFVPSLQTKDPNGYLISITRREE